jgi:hypothetical protein
LIPAARLTLDYFVRHAEGDATSMLLYRAGRGLPIRELARHSWLKSIIWWLHCFKNRVPLEHRAIHAAHLRGIKRGLQLAGKISPEKFPA